MKNHSFKISHKLDDIDLQCLVKCCESYDTYEEQIYYAFQVGCRFGSKDTLKELKREIELQELTV